MTPGPTGEIVADWTEFGHHFQIEKLDPPVQKGSGLRHYRLWDGGEPALGWQWCYDVESAKSRAEYLLNSSYIRRIEFLERRVHELEAENATLKGIR